MAEALVCPGCGATPGSGAGAEAERFCAECGLPLVHADRSGLERPVTAAHERARKVRPQYTEGALVTVAGARNQAEAEMIQGILLEEGVPSMLRRTRGFDVPDMLAAGPRDVLVPASGAGPAREVLLQADLLDARTAEAERPGRLFAGLLAVCALVAVVAWVGTELIA